MQIFSPFASLRSYVALFLTLVCSLGVKASTNDLPVRYGTFNVRYADGDKKNALRCWDARRNRVAAFIVSQLSLIHI